MDLASVPFILSFFVAVLVQSGVLAIVLVGVFFRRCCMFEFDFITERGYSHYTNSQSHYMINSEGNALKFVGYRRGDNATDWVLLGPKTANFIKRDLLIQEIEAGLHD